MPLDAIPSILVCITIADVRKGCGWPTFRSGGTIEIAPEAVIRRALRLSAGIALRDWNAPSCGQQQSAKYPHITGQRAALVRAVGIEGLYPNALVISEWGPWIRARAAAQRHGDLAGRFGGDTGAADGGDKGAVAEIELMRRVKRALDPANVMNPGKLVSL
jgi:FAD/FMN-containing dehydrogenase